MSSATFASAAAGAPPPDPSKHVKFTQGMVLGVDDFDQEFAYLSNRDQWLARDTIGYGTVCGLRVGLEKKDGDFEVSVSPGVAINPRGQLIRVAPRQCASLGTWLSQQNPSDLGLTNDSAVTAYVVLCYRDCPTDQVPVPGEPCRCDTDTMAPSRIIDDFRLELTLTKPPQLEEDAVRDFVAWLREIEVADFNPAQGDLHAFLQAIRDAVGGITSPPESPPPDYFYGSPPVGLQIPRSRFCEWMRAAMRLWVTELRPFWQAQCAPQKACGCSAPCGCHGTGVEPDNMACDCLLLAEVWITRSGGAVTDARLDQERRPFLVHLRMLEELMLCGPCCAEAGSSEMPEALAGDVNGPISSNIVEAIQGFPVEMSSPPAPDTLLGFDGTKWYLTEPPSAPPPDANFVEHSQGAGEYHIVAAGVMTIGLTPIVNSSYNNLRLVIPDLHPVPNTKLVTFDGYDVTHMANAVHIVKGTSLGTAPAIFHVNGFENEGFRIQFPNGYTGKFMIEVSLFFTPL